MKNKIFLYLFIFMALIALYLFVSNGNMQKVKNERIKNMETEIVQLKDSVQKVQPH